MFLVTRLYGVFKIAIKADSCISETRPKVARLYIDFTIAIKADRNTTETRQKHDSCILPNAVKARQTGDSCIYIKKL